MTVRWEGGQRTVGAPPLPQGREGAQNLQKLAGSSFFFNLGAPPTYGLRKLQLTFFSVVVATATGRVSLGDDAGTERGRKIA